MVRLNQELCPCTLAPLPPQAMHRSTALRSYVQLEFLEFTYFIIFRRSPSPVVGDSRPNSSLNRELSGRDSPLLARREKVQITCLGMLYSPIIMQNVEGKACPDAMQFLMAGTQVGAALG